MKTNLSNVDDPAQKSTSVDPATLQKRIDELEEQLKIATDAQLRSQADYQNLQRRNQEERVRMIKLATKEFVSGLIEPLNNLNLAISHFNDQGLKLTVKQLWQALNNFGLEEFNPVGQEFDVSLMEAVDRQGEGTTVLSVVKRGYKLNGEVIQHAKVIVGNANNSKDTKKDKDQKTAKTNA